MAFFVPSHLFTMYRKQVIMDKVYRWDHIYTRLYAEDSHEFGNHTGIQKSGCVY
jgi:hypothetical protein